MEISSDVVEHLLCILRRENHFESQSSSTVSSLSLLFWTMVFYLIHYFISWLPRI